MPSPRFARRFETSRSHLRRRVQAGRTSVQVNSYHVGLQAQGDILLRVAAEFLAEPYPAWTAVGITELFEQGALVELSCIALMAD